MFSGCALQDSSFYKALQVADGILLLLQLWFRYVFSFLAENPAPLKSSSNLRSLVGLCHRHPTTQNMRTHEILFGFVWCECFDWSWQRSIVFAAFQDPWSRGQAVLEDLVWLELAQRNVFRYELARQVASARTHTHVLHCFSPLFIDAACAWHTVGDYELYAAITDSAKDLDLVTATWHKWFITIPVVPHKAAAEVSKMENQ